MATPAPDLRNAYVLIMAGGIGSRFWPRSRTSYPKQFHDLMGTGRTLLQATYDRFLPLIPAERIFVVTNQQYVDRVREQLPELPLAQVLAEPTGRNTAPCIAYGTARISALDPNARLVVTPADHMILNERAFLRDIRIGLELVQQQPVIVTLGISPTRPDTGYGYIQYNEDVSPRKRVYKVKTFTEKPTLDVARSFIQSGDFVWNSGLFLFQLQTMQQALAQYLPDLSELFEPVRSVAGTRDEAALVASIYPKTKNISIDIGVMEKAQNVYVIRSSFGWSDLGTWASLHKQMPRDEGNNAVVGNAILYGSKGNMVQIGAGKMAVLKGVHNLIVVADDDVLLICRRDQEQSIREILADLRSRTDADRYL